MSHTAQTATTQQPVHAARKWIAALPLAGLLVACSSFAQNAPGQHAGFELARVDFHSCARPVYPHDELAARHEGTVDLSFQVTADGTVAGSRVERSSGYPALDEAALDALSKCHFQPSRKDGQAVSSRVPVKYVWSLK